MFKRAAAILIGVLAIGVLAGCGGDDDDGGNGGTNTGTAAAETGAETTTDDGGSNGDSEGGGDGEGDESSETPSVTKAVFVKEANAICKETGETIRKEALTAAKNLEKAEDPIEAQVALATTLVIPALETEVSEIRALGVPDGDEEQVEAIVTALQEIVDKANEDPKKYVETPRPYTAAQNTADPYGLTECPVG